MDLNFKLYKPEFDSCLGFTIINRKYPDKETWCKNAQLKISSDTCKIITPIEKWFIKISSKCNHVNKTVSVKKYYGQKLDKNLVFPLDEIYIIEDNNNLPGWVKLSEEEAENLAKEELKNKKEKEDNKECNKIMAMLKGFPL